MTSTTGVVAEPARRVPPAAAGEPRPRLPFRPDIEGMRGLAVLLVVAYHAGVPGVTSGFIGVDVFFVLSGYLITMILAGEIAATGRIDLSAFYARRVRRLLPAAALVITVTLAVGLLLHPPHLQRELARTAVAAGAYLSNVWLGRQAGDYFGNRAEADPLLHMWSLSVEEQFYLVWPILLFLGLRGRAARQRLGLFMVALILITLAASWWYSIVSRPLAFFASPLRSWEFAAGGLLSLMPRRTRLGAGAVRLVGVAGLTGVVAWSTVLTEADPFPGLNALPVVVGTLLMLWPGHVALSRPRFLGHAVMQRLGALSYSWYLWHWPALVFLAVLVPDPAWPLALVVAVASLAPAALAYRLIEQPIRRHRWLSAAPRRSLLFGVAVTVAVVAAGLATIGISGRTAQTPAYQAITAAALKGPLEKAGCVARFSEEQLVECVFGDGTGPVVVLLGDSHASHWGAGLIPAVEANGGTLITLTKSSCPSADFPVRQVMLGRRYVECERWRARAFDRVTELRPDVLLVANSRGYLRGHLYLGVGDPYRSWEVALGAALARLSTVAEHVVVLEDTPWRGGDVPECLASTLRLFGRADACSVPMAEAFDLRMAASNRTIAAGLPNVTVADFSDRFCAGGVCPAAIDGVIAYRDGHHLSTAMAASFRGDLEALIRARISAPSAPIRRPIATAP